MSTITLGVDLAKSVFSVRAMDGAGHVLERREFKREAFAVWLAQRPAGTVVAMEACSGAHHWARRCVEYGLQPRLMAAQLVKPYRKSQRSKNDRNDAEAIATEKATPEQRWARSLAARLSFGKVLVAIANKHARQLWVMLAHEVDYDPCACQRHPLHRPAQLA